MLTNAMLDVVIGLVFLFLTLSLICTTINELISGVLKLRARTLRQALTDLLDDDALKKAFQETPQMRVIQRMSGSVGPSYVPAATFVSAIIDAAKAKTGPGGGTAPDGSAFAALPDSNAKEVLLGIANDVKDDTAALKLRVAEWFDDMMDRAAGRFKRQMGAITLLCAMAISIAVNADSISIAKSLWADTSLRSQLAETAETFAFETDYVEDLMELSEVGDALRPFPLGWNFDSPVYVTDWHQSFGGVFLKILGLIITGMAVSLGAPFWFDVLSRFMKLRSAGPKPRQSEKPATA